MGYSDLVDKLHFEGPQFIRETTVESSISYLPSQIGAVKSIMTSLAKEKPDWGIEILDSDDPHHFRIENKYDISVPREHWDGFMSLFKGKISGNKLNLKQLSGKDITESVVNEEVEIYSKSEAGAVDRDELSSVRELNIDVDGLVKLLGDPTTEEPQMEWVGEIDGVPFIVFVSPSGEVWSMAEYSKTNRTVEKYLKLEGQWAQPATEQVPNESRINEAGQKYYHVIVYGVPIMDPNTTPKYSGILVSWVPARSSSEAKKMAIDFAKELGWTKQENYEGQYTSFDARITSKPYVDYAYRGGHHHTNFGHPYGWSLKEADDWERAHDWHFSTKELMTRPKKVSGKKNESRLNEHEFVVNDGVHDFNVKFIRNNGTDLEYTINGGEFITDPQAMKAWKSEDKTGEPPEEYLRQVVLDTLDGIPDEVYDSIVDDYKLHHQTKESNKVDTVRLLTEALEDDLSDLRKELKVELTKMFHDKEFADVKRAVDVWKSTFSPVKFKTQNVAVRCENEAHDIQKLYGDLLREYGKDKGGLEMLITAIQERRPLNQFEVFKNKFEFLYGSRVQGSHEHVKLVFEGTVNFIIDWAQSIYVSDPEVLEAVEDEFKSTIKRSKNVLYPRGGSFKPDFFMALRKKIDEVIESGAKKEEPTSKDDKHESK